MVGKKLELTEYTLSVIEEIGGHMPGGFFIYRAAEPEELIYANKPVFDIFGCADLEEFRALTGFTFRGMVYPEDYDRISASIADQIGASEDHMDYAEYRITRRDGKIRWVDDYGHYCDTGAYGGIYVVFISDITEKHEQRDVDNATRDAVLMDIQMPVMNGYAATRAIRALDGADAQALPIIAISANAYEEDVRACLAAGMNAHMAKPFNPDDLLKLLHAQIRR